MKTIKVFLLVILILSSLYVAYIRPVSATEDSWASKEPMLTARSGLGVAVVEGKIYAIGGSNPSYLGTNEMYDPETDTWTTKTPMPNPRRSFAIAVVENKIYVIGGANPWGFSSINQVYDPATDTWENKTSMPTDRANLCASVVDGKIYVIGGSFLLYWPEPTNLTEVYDPETDTWTRKASMPTAVYDCTSAVIDNKIYVVPTNDIGGWSGVLQIYDSETDTWSYGKKDVPTITNLPVAAATTGVYAPKRIYVMGGYELPVTGLNQIYDPETDTWSLGTQMPTPRYNMGVAVVNDTLYAIGGYDDGSATPRTENERYTPSGYIPEFPSWAPLVFALFTVAVVLIVYKQKLCKTQIVGE